MAEYDIINEVVVDAPPARVWAALIAELSGAGRWWVPANTFRIGALPPDAVGGETLVTVHTKGVGNGGPKLRFTSRTDVVEPERRLSGTYVDGVFRGTNEYLLEQLPDGRTLLAMHFRAAPHGVGKLLGKVADIGGEHLKATGAAFGRLAEVLATEKPAAEKPATVGAR